MIYDSIDHQLLIIDMAVNFQKVVHFTTISQLSEPDRRNVRLKIDNPTRDMQQTLILKKAPG